MKRLSAALLVCLSVWIAAAGGQQSGDPAYVPGELIVKFRPGASQTRRDSALAVTGARVVRRFTNFDLHHVALPQGQSVENAIAALQANPDVEFAQPNFIRHTTQSSPPNDPLWLNGTLWGLLKIQAQSAWSSYTTGDSSVVVADIDTGINYNHPDLAANIWTNPLEVAANGFDDDGDGYIDDVHGINVLTHSGDPMDDNGHGTHTAGTMAAVGNNGVGVVGVNWNAKIISCKFLDSSGSGSDAGAIECFNYVVTLKQRGVNIRVTNNSWGGTRSGGIDQGLKTAIDAAGSAGILNAFAAGNNNANNDTTPFDPASIPSTSIIAVAASDSSDNRASFSNYGPTTVHLAAPGVSITSTYGSGYNSLSGTSMATPHVAGSAAILAFLNPTLSPEAIKSVLMNNVDVLPQWAGTVVSGGRLNLFKAATAVVTTTPPTVSLTSPSGGASFVPPAPITLTANASKPGGSVSSVKFYANGTLVGTSTVSPYNVTWSGMASGAYTLTAMATDNLGLTATSAAVAITVDAKPTVSLTSPTNGLGITSTTVPLTAAASDSDGTVASVKFFANGNLIDTATTAPYNFNWTNVAPGVYVLTAMATDNLGATTMSAGATVTVTAPSNVPAPWFNQDVGAVGATGSASLAGGTFTVTGSGADVWGTADAFQFVYQPLTGDGQIVARVATQQNTEVWALAGVMIRDTLLPGAAHAALFVSPSSGLAFEQRVTTGGVTTYTGASGVAPRWLKLVRTGTTVTASQSLDGMTWTPVGSTSVGLGSTVEVGLAVCSHVNGVLGTATFDNVSVTAAGGNTPPTVSLTAPTAGATYVAPATISLAANASDSDGIASVKFYQNGTLINTDTTAPYAFNWTNVAAGTYLLTAAATDALGATTTSAGVTVTVTPSGGGLPPPWVNQDVGTVGAAGSTMLAGGTFTVTGSGADVWGTADAFQFVYQSLTGDGQIVARVATQQNTAAWALAGVMIRDTLAAGAAHAALFVSPSSGLAFEQRVTAGGVTTYTGTSGVAPRWVKLVRTGTTVTASQSLDGVTWTTVGSTSVGLGSTAEVGLAVCSHADGVLGTATFDNVSVTAAGGNTPPTVSLTAPTAGATYAAPATVTLTATANDSDGIASVKFYQNGTLINTDTAAPYTFDWTNVAVGTYVLTAMATDTLGATTTSTGVTVTVNPTGGSLPPPWLNQDVGAVGAVGSTTAAGGTFTVTGSGADVWGTADAFQFVYQSLTGDGQIIARVATQQNTAAWALAGVMIRDTLLPGAAHAALFVSPSSGLAFEQRVTTGGVTTYTSASGVAPRWVKLVRTGTTVTASQSLDGMTWTPVGSTSVGLGSTAEVGLAVCSHADGVLGTATFDNVSVTAAGGNTPPTVSLTAPTAGATYVAPATVTLTATASDTDGIASVKFYQNGTLINTDTTAPYTFDWTGVTAGTYVLTAMATDMLGATTTSAGVTVTVTPSGGGLPPPWVNQDVGAVGPAGSTIAATGTFTVTGSGADIWGTADAFQFVYQPLSGDGQIIARVATQQNTAAWALAGVMIRDTLAAGATHASLFVSPSSGLAFEQRMTTGGVTTYTGASGVAPRWVRLVRAGTTVTASQSLDGLTWTSIGSTSVALGMTSYVGLVVCSHASGVLGTATFDNVSVTGNGALAPAPVQSSTLTVRMDFVGHMPNHTNPTSAAVVGSQLLLIDQAGYIYRWDGTATHDLLTPATFPTGIFPPGGESVLNVAGDAAGSHVFVMFSTFTAPTGIPISVSPRPFDSWQVLYKYDYDGSALSNPSAIRAFQVRSDGHTGGGLVVLSDGSVLCAIGDNGDAGEDGRSYAQDPTNHLAKILHVNPADGSVTVVALGVRNVQRLAVDPNAGDPRLNFADIGGYVAEELNSIRLANILDGTMHDFGWGRSSVDNKAREGTFYIDANGSAVGSAPAPETGFLQPVAQWGREGAPLIAASGPVTSTISFSTITSLFGDLPTGAVFATTGLMSSTGQPVFHVALVDNTLQPITLMGLASGNRPDPRFFSFPDGTAGVLLERTGDFYRLTQVAAPPVPSDQR